MAFVSAEPAWPTQLDHLERVPLDHPERVPLDHPERVAPVTVATFRIAHNGGDNATLRTTP